MSRKTNRNKTSKRRGGGLTEFAVPAALLYANQFFGSKDASRNAFNSAKTNGNSKMHRKKHNTYRLRKSSRRYR